MRGKVVVNRKLGYRRRITPAYAGKSATYGLALTPPRDHPRVCGEKNGLKRSMKKRIGSPPRMRGKVMRVFDLSKVERITPAYAGKRSAPLTLVRAPRDHPRVCGEKKPPCQPERKALGSPPRMRGKVPAAVWLPIFVRITPAYAGKR